MERKMQKKGIPTITEDEAKMCWEKHINGSSIDIKSIVPTYVGNQNDKLVQEDLVDLCDELQKIKEEFSGGIRGKVSIIDRKLVRPFHQTLIKYVDPKFLEDLGDQKKGFWLWLNNYALEGDFCKFINWRHETFERKGPYFVNWGFPKNSKFRENESYFTRIWLRGLMYDQDLPNNPYSFGEIGFSETWRVRLLDNEYFKNNPQAIKMFFKTIYGSNLEFKNKPNFLEIKEKELYKKITQKLKSGNIDLNNKKFCDKFREEIWSAVPEEINSAKESVNELYSDIKDREKNQEINREVERRLINVIYRKEQKLFRKDVINNCSEKCVVTKEKHLGVCHASHIKDVQHEGPFIVENGLLLRSDIHELFDRGDILIDQDGNLTLGEGIPKNSKYIDLSNSKIDLPNNINREFICWKYDRMQNSCK